MNQMDVVEIHNEGGYDHFKPITISFYYSLTLI